MRGAYSHGAFFGACLLILIVAVIPHISKAMGADADAMCIPGRDYSCPCGTVCKPGGLPGGLNCPCRDTTSGFVTQGVCITQNKCLGKTSGGQGGDMQGLQQALGLAKQIMDLLKGAGGGGGGGGGAGDIPQIPSIPCPSGYYNVSSSSTDPCAIYNPNPLDGFSGTSNISNNLLNALGGDTSNTNTNTQAVTNTATTSTNTVQSQPIQTGTATSVGGLSGNLRVGTAGATIVANLKQGISEVAGFFGGNTFSGNTSNSVASRMCAARPWAGTGILASIAPDSFFDGICSKAGYQVGYVNPVIPTGVAQPRTTTQPAATTTRPIVTNSLPPQADIWAEPASVRLGTRTYIFWKSQNALECAVAGPNFSQKSLSGGASTVSISGPTTYTIECSAADGTKATDSVTVDLAL